MGTFNILADTIDRSCVFSWIINHLLTEEKKETLFYTGVRALLLYPMNALANDQIARLRMLAENFPNITFGRYTGETEQSEDKAIDNYHQYHEGKDPLPNELICRDQMQTTPPHILFTNYAMLEYLLIRPKDSPLFDGGRWRFIVLDEIHSYSGALGVEVAMLLRRLKDRVVNSEMGRLQCFGTSATLGEGEKDYPKIAKFAASLFGEKFAEADVVGASRKKLEDLDRPVCGTGSATLYKSVREKVFSNEPLDLSALKHIMQNEIPESIVSKAELSTEKFTTLKGKTQAFLHYVLVSDGQVQNILKRLEKERALELLDLKDIEGLSSGDIYGSPPYCKRCSC